MKKLFLIPVIFSFVIVLSVNNYGQTKEAPKKEAPKVEKLNTVCPVSGEDIDDDGVIVKYKGKSYQVCCKKCAAKFKKFPEKYLKNLKENVDTPEPDKEKKEKVDKDK